MKLKFKILSGFSILAFMLLIAGGWSIWELHSAGKVVVDILEENYKSITAAKLMKESLEREDSAILLHLLEKKEHALDILKPADSTFYVSLNKAKMNVTLAGELDLINSIDSFYSSFQKSWENQIIKGNEFSDINIYMTSLHPKFVKAKEKIDELIDLNDKEMYKSGMQIKDRSQRAIMPGIIAMISAIIFTLLFNYFVNKYMINPIINITEGINKFTSKRVQFTYNVETKDEISDLCNSVSVLTSHVTADETFK